MTMPLYRYKARNRLGALVTGRLEAKDAGEIERLLDRMNLIPIRLSSSSGRGLFSWRTKALSTLSRKVPQEEIIVFSRQLSTLFGAGVPLTRALFTLERQTTGKRFAGVLKLVREDVEGGGTFSKALSRHPDVFPELYANMVEAGEAGGILDSVLDRLSSMLEKNAENRAKVKSATLYPKIVLGAIITAVVILMNFVVPKFARLYASFKVELPLPTRALIFLSNWFLNYWYLGAAFILLTVFSARYYVSTESGRIKWDYLRMRVPVFGPVILKSTMSRFAGVLSSLYRSGLPILQSLDIVSRAVDNRLLAREIKAIEAEVRAGKNLSEPMGRSDAFPPIVVQMVTVGEETGNLDEMLDKIAEYYDRDVDASIRNLTSTLEPVLLGFIFLAVLFLALAIFLPMWDILKIVRK